MKEPDRHVTMRDNEYIARRPVTDLYDHFTTPPYSRGRFVIDLVDRGIGKYHFFEDDPDYVYFTPFGHHVIVDDGFDRVGVFRQAFMGE